MTGDRDDFMMLTVCFACVHRNENRQAYATRDDLDRQRSTLLSVNQRINNVATQLPSVGQLIGKIQSRKNRDNVILSCVIGSCVVGVLYFVM